MNKTLLIDDLRQSEFVNKKYNVEVTDIAITFNEGIRCLKEGQIDTLLLDHDLGCFNDNGKEMTGYDVMLFLEENQEYLPKRIILVTSNPVGRAKMQVVIDKLYKKE